MTLPVTLSQAAANLGPEIDERLLYREHRAGRLRAWKFGRRLFTSEGDIQDWITLCRGKDSRPASTSDKESRPAGSSSTVAPRSGQATALSAANRLLNCGPRLPTTSAAGSSGHPGPERRSA